MTIFLSFINPEAPLVDDDFDWNDDREITTNEAEKDWDDETENHQFIALARWHDRDYSKNL